MGIFNFLKKQPHLEETKFEIDNTEKNETDVADKFNELLKRIHEFLKPLGYKKETLNFRLYQPDGLCKIINFQKSQWNTKEYLEFYINIGIYFEKNDTISNLKFKVFECVIEKRIASDNVRWSINKNTDINILFESVKNALEESLEDWRNFNNKENAIQLILNNIDNDKYSGNYYESMRYRTAKLLANMGYSNEVYNIIKDSKTHSLVELANQIKNKNKTKKIDIFPNQLDNANVLLYTDKGDYGTVDYTDGRIHQYVQYLAICSYPDALGYYLFFCNDNYDVITDDFCDSIEQCKEIANSRKKDIVWKEK